MPIDRHHRRWWSSFTAAFDGHDLCFTYMSAFLTKQSCNVLSFWWYTGSKLTSIYCLTHGRLDLVTGIINCKTTTVSNLYMLEVMLSGLKKAIWRWTTLVVKLSIFISKLFVHFGLLKKWKVVLIFVWHHLTGVLWQDLEERKLCVLLGRSAFYPSSVWIGRSMRQQGLFPFAIDHRWSAITSTAYFRNENRVEAERPSQ